MSTTKPWLTILAVSMFTVSFAQSAAAQEWKILSDDNRPGLGSVKSFIQSTLGPHEKPSDLRRSEPTKDSFQYLTDREILRLNNDRTREYAREGSWAPLETKPGEENFHLLTF